MAKSTAVESPATEARRRLHNRLMLAQWLRNLAGRLETGEYSVAQVFRLMRRRLDGVGVKE
jgi:nitrate reductase assembly molybdenum cofactor insertion protein NarJ